MVDNGPSCGQFDGSHCRHSPGKYSIRGCGLIDPTNKRFLVWTIELSNNALTKKKERDSTYWIYEKRIVWSSREKILICTEKAMKLNFSTDPLIWDVVHTHHWTNSHHHDNKPHPPTIITDRYLPHAICTTSHYVIMTSCRSRLTCLWASKEVRMAKCGVRNSLSLIIKRANAVKGRVWTTRYDITGRPSIDDELEGDVEREREREREGERGREMLFVII